MKNYLLLFFSTISFSISCISQESAIEDDKYPDILKIFLDCQTRCDMTYFRQEMGFVNFMQDRQEAEVLMPLR